MNKNFLLLFLAFFSLQMYAQPTTYSTANAHSHNDYEQARPFYEAWEKGFGSIEADIFLAGNELLVAHTEKELDSNRTLQRLYLDPLKKMLSNNHGSPYADNRKELQLLIDVKTDSVKTLDKLIEILKNYPSITNCHKIKIAISGNRPPAEKFIHYPSFIYFDGVLGRRYSALALSKIIMLSDDFETYSQWKGLDFPSEADYNLLLKLVKKSHALKKKVRFWDAPDTPNAWRMFMKLHADYINTDHIPELAHFLIKAH
ncbi:MAG: phosphatidylinositol-specific phospholipase C/glycerophosphodiester phosphodiesterase family protein [Bacteroidetes bacterium]|nr:phosphatidylinositol-specific phospholipase C/glycerophosphodiester phosphodiesterase family protein [Bacteroidota bacterium]MBS1973493.1 phosphatidylinositol-specific phospholipase C/glycerophosphodiester phosphodiesterase family protein [Bacteroidota bacterium]